jgi:hypothetical protein
MNLIDEDPNITLYKGFSIHSIEQVHASLITENTRFTGAN